MERTLLRFHFLRLGGVRCRSHIYLAYIYLRRPKKKKKPSQDMPHCATKPYGWWCTCANEYDNLRKSWSKFPGRNHDCSLHVCGRKLYTRDLLWARSMGWSYMVRILIASPLWNSVSEPSFLMKCRCIASITGGWNSYCMGESTDRSRLVIPKTT